MINRKLGHIVKQQKPLTARDSDRVREACRMMADSSAGSILVVDGDGRLAGIFTGRDAVRVLACGLDPAATALADAMTRNPTTISPDKRAIDALRLMWECGFRHLPVVEDGRIWGIVSRGDFRGEEIERMDEEQHLWETIR